MATTIYLVPLKIVPGRSILHYPLYSQADGFVRNICDVVTRKVGVSSYE